MVYSSSSGGKRKKKKKTAGVAQQRETDAVLEGGGRGCRTRREENGGKAERAWGGYGGTGPRLQHSAPWALMLFVSAREGKFGSGGWRACHLDSASGANTGSVSVTGTYRAVAVAEKKIDAWQRWTSLRKEQRRTNKRFPPRNPKYAPRGWAFGHRPRNVSCAAQRKERTPVVLRAANIPRLWLRRGRGSGIHHTWVSAGRGRAALGSGEAILGREGRPITVQAAAAHVPVVCRRFDRHPRDGDDREKAAGTEQSTSPVTLRITCLLQGTEVAELSLKAIILPRRPAMTALVARRSA